MQSLRQAKVRHALHYWRIARAADQMYQRDGQDLQLGLTLFDEEWSNIKAAQAWAAKNSETDTVAAEMCSFYANDCASLIELRQHALVWTRWLKEALVAAGLIGRANAIAIHTGNLGIAYSHIGKTDEAIRHFRKHLALSRQQRDQKGEQTALANLGIMYRNRGEVRRSIGFFKKSLTLALARSDQRAEGTALSNLGTSHAALGEIHIALTYQQRALSISQELKNWRDVGHRLGDMGLLLVDHDPHRSITLFIEQLKIARQLQDRRSEAAAIGNLGKAFALSGRYAVAKELFDQHLQIAREIGDVRSQLIALTNLGAALSTLGPSDRGLQAFDEALLIARQISDLSGEAKALYDKAVALERLGSRRTAIEFAEAALEIFAHIEECVSAFKIKGKLEVWRGLVEVA